MPGPTRHCFEDSNLLTSFSRQQPPVLPPPATLETGMYTYGPTGEFKDPCDVVDRGDKVKKSILTNFAGGQPFYPLPSLPSLGNGAGHPQPGHGFSIPSINPGHEGVPFNQVCSLDMLDAVRVKYCKSDTNISSLHQNNQNHHKNFEDHRMLR